MIDTAQRVLIVDDEASIRRYLRVILGAKGFATHEAKPGQEALDSVVSYDPEIIILDLGSPDIDGIEVTRGLRAWSPTPIIVLSVREVEHDKVAALHAGADGYLTKPFGTSELMARIRVALRRASKGPDEFSNIHLAWQWGAQNKLYLSLHEVFLAFWGAYDIRGRTRDGFLATAALIEALRAEPVTTQTKTWLGRALAYHAVFCYRSGEYLRGRTAIDESIAILRSLDLSQLLIEPLIYSTIIYGLTGDITAAQANVDEGVALARQCQRQLVPGSGNLQPGCPVQIKRRDSACRSTA